MRLRDDLGLPHARDQRPALHVRRRRRRARGAAVRAVGQDHGRPQAVQARRPRLLPEVPGGDAPGLAGAAGGVRHHAAGRRAGVRLRRGVQLPRPDAALRGARGRDRGQLAGRRGRARAGPAVPGRRAGDAPQAGGVRARRHHPDGLPGLLPRRRRPVPARPRVGHPGRAGPRVGRRRPGGVLAGHHRARPAAARPDLRALPQPRPDLHARHRHGLRRAPARRHDPLRDREVRRGAGRADHHVRHDQGQAGGQGLGPGARLPVLDRRPDHQGDAAAGDGQGRPAARHLRRVAPAVAGRRRSSARSTRRTRRSSGSSTPPAGWRGSSGSGACTPPG